MISFLKRGLAPLVAGDGSRKVQVILVEVHGVVITWRARGDVVVLVRISCSTRVAWRVE